MLATERGPTACNGTARFEPSAVHTQASGWLQLAIAVTSTILAGWNEGESLDLAIETLTSIDAEHGDAARPEDIANDWWDSPANSWHAARPRVCDADDEWPDTVNERACSAASATRKWRRGSPSLPTMESGGNGRCG